MDYREWKEDDEEAMNGRDGGSLLSQTLCIAVLTIRERLTLAAERCGCSSDMPHWDDL